MFTLIRSVPMLYGENSLFSLNNVMSDDLQLWGAFIIKEIIHHNALRFGFASLSEEELIKAVDILKNSIYK